MVLTEVKNQFKLSKVSGVELKCIHTVGRLACIRDTTWWTYTAFIIMVGRERGGGAPKHFKMCNAF